jgi:hypothetical protein
VLYSYIDGQVGLSDGRDANLYNLITIESIITCKFCINYQDTGSTSPVSVLLNSYRRVDGMK